MKQTYSPSSRRKDWIQTSALALLLGLSSLANAQQGSWGNVGVSNSGNATLFGAHRFAVGADAPQPGKIITARTAPFGTVSFGPTATYSGATDASHVDGYVRKYGTAAFTFPIGNGTKLRPVSISAPTSGDFTAAYWFENPGTATLPAGNLPVANLGIGVTAVSNVEYWDVDGPSAVSLTLTWDAASNLNTLSGGSLSNLSIVGYNPTTSKWESLGGTATGTLTGTGNIVAIGVTPDNYVAYTFGSVQAATPPDLRPFVIMPNTSFTPSTVTRNFSVRVMNVKPGSAATEMITLRVYKPTPTSTIVLNGTSPANWTITNSGLYYTLTTNLDIVEPITDILVTGQVTIPGATATGSYPLRAFIPDLSGGELIGDNGNNNHEIRVSKTN